MDGYAFRHLDLVNSGDTKMQVIETWLARVNQDAAPRLDNVYALVTGAALPKRRRHGDCAGELVERLSEWFCLIPFTLTGERVACAVGGRRYLPG